MLKFALLGFLNYTPMTGYELEGWINASTGNFWHAELSQIYKTLKQLEKSGEVIKMFIVVKPGMTVTKEQVMEHMRANVTGYKVPRYIEFRDTLPTTNVGKILRRELRDIA